MQTLERPQSATQTQRVARQMEEPRAHALTRHEYQLLTEAGAFEGRRVELIEGVIYDKMAAMLGPHAMAVSKTSSHSLQFLVAKPPSEFNFQFG